MIRCNETNPCTGFSFENVKSHGLWTWLGFNYIVENVEGTVINSKPIPAFNGVDTSAGDTPGTLPEIFASWFKSHFDILVESSTLTQVA